MSPALVSCSLDRASIEPQGTTLIVPLSLGTPPVTDSSLASVLARRDTAPEAGAGCPMSACADCVGPSSAREAS